MADLTITASEVSPGPNAVIAHGIAGETITAGQALYKDSSDNNQLKRTDANGVASAQAVGIALHAALEDQPLAYQTAGTITLGATASPQPGNVYLVSATAGGIRPETDLGGVSEYTTILGVGISDTDGTMKMSILISDVIYS